MEISHTEQSRNSRVNQSVRDRIVDFHDRRLKVSPLSEDIVKTFESIAASLRSEKGKQIIETVRPKMKTYAKNAEIGIATVDYVVGLATTGLGVSEWRKKSGENTIQIKKLRAATPELKSVEENISAYMREIGQNKLKRRQKITGIGVGVLALRPITRLTDLSTRITRPVAVFAAKQVDAILLRQEQKTAVKQVFVGTGRA